MEIPEKRIWEHPVEKKYSISWRWDFEVNSRDLVQEISNEKNESVYLLTNFIDWTYRFDRIADGGEGEVSFDATKLKMRKWIINYVIYHNHPRSTEPTLSPPSSDDFMTASRVHSKFIIHKIITEHGIWKFQMIDIKKAQDIAPKLGILLNYLVGEYIESELTNRIKTLQWINPVYLSVANTYKILLKEKRTSVIPIFREAVWLLGFDIDFEEYSK
jgi:hypothetical protein